MLPSGTHTVTISWTGTSGGGGTHIGLDAFDVIGTFVQALRSRGAHSVIRTPTVASSTPGSGTTSATGSASGGCFRSIDASGSAGITFQGTSVAWVASKGPASGIARVMLDGVDQGTVDLYSSSTSLPADSVERRRPRRGHAHPQRGVDR